VTLTRVTSVNGSKKLLQTILIGRLLVTQLLIKILDLSMEAMEVRVHGHILRTVQTRGEADV
jgi:hypothetical protein